MAMTKTLRDVAVEVERAKGIHSGAFNSHHEAYAVTKEEFDELWEEVRKKVVDKKMLRTEAIQAAAMLTRWCVELTDSQ